MPGRILIIDDDAGFSRAMARNLRRAGHDVALCSTAEEARAQLPRTQPDVVVVDYQLPDADGLALLGELRQRSPGAQLMMASAYPDLDVAVEAMRRGAFDYVAKGSDARECLIRIERAAEVAMLRRRMAEASHPPVVASSHNALLGDSDAMKALRSRLEALGGSDDTTALILGETGTGKSLVARAIHAGSRRAFEPLVAVDCTTIPVTLVESELFGHEKGAFSGASNSKQGRVEAAGRGTLFLDEIGELDLPVQTKLLRLLEEREFTRVGSTRTRHLLARIITATNRNLAKAVEEGRFRADLRYRLEVFVVEVPPLRARGDDILLLTSHFAQERARILGRARPELHPELMRALLSYPFPGNVRELRNMVEQAVLLCRGDELTVEDFPVLSRVVQGEGQAAGQADQGPPPRDAHARQPGSGQPPASHVPRPQPSTSGGAAAAGWAGTAPAHVARRSPEPLARAGQVSHGMTSHANGESETAPPIDARSAAVEGGDSGGPETLSDIRAQRAAEERAALIEALRGCGGNVSAAARMLDMSRHQMMRRLAKYGLR